MALRGVYRGIDLVFYGNERQLEYDWVVAPGGDPKQILVKWEGASPITKNAGGDLVLSTSMLQQKPVIVQEGKRVEGGYVVNGREVAFEVAQYDTKKPLVIDPVLVYSTYLGGSGISESNGIAVDWAGNAYVTGTTLSADFPISSPLQAHNNSIADAFVTKINANGSALIYSTYLGGNDAENGRALAVDGSGSAYVTGETWSRDFPTANALQATFPPLHSICAFVTKLNAAGSTLAYSTYLCGYNFGDDFGKAIAVDGLGNAYVTGSTGSMDFPTINPLQAKSNGHCGTFSCTLSPSAFVSKINPAGSALVYSTYLGG